MGRLFLLDEGFQMTVLKAVGSDHLRVPKDVEERIRQKARDNGCGELGRITTEAQYEEALACAVPERMIKLLREIGE